MMLSGKGQKIYRKLRRMWLEVMRFRTLGKRLT